MWLVDGQRLWLAQRPATGVWAGLWTLPLFHSAPALEATLVSWPGRGETLPTIEHALTHFDWTLEPLRHTLPTRLSAKRRAAIEAALESAVGKGRWFSRDEALALGLPAPIRKLISSR